MSPKVRILDPEALKQIAPAAIHAYALSQGWKRTESFGDHSDVYVRDGVEVILPGTSSLGDYPRAVSDALQIFSRVESRGQLQLYRDLITADQDVVRVRAIRASDDGSIGVESGVNLVVQARNLLLSAACAASGKRPAFRAGRMKEASEYLRRVSLGQTERGSFIITLLTPVPPSLETTHQQTLWPQVTEEPFERLVTRLLVDGLEAAKEAIEKTNRGSKFEVFEAAIQRGVSANLCEATASLIEEGDGVDLSVTWARTRPTPEKRRTVRFAPADASILKEAAKLFRDREPRADERLEGYITKLARDEDERDGRATLKTFVDESPVAVRVDLSKSDYDAAVRAHERQLAVWLRGDLTREGHRWTLKNPRELTVIEEDGDELSQSSS